jgi:RNA polymerase sigma-70 factor (ECF subfamily)
LPLSARSGGAARAPAPPRSRADVAALYAAHGHVVLRRARRILNDEAEAQDILQEIFLSLVHDPEQFAGSSHVTTFLYAATTNRCLNRLRDAKTQARLLAERARSEATDARGERLAQLRQVLGRLPEDLARVAVFSYVDEMTHEEIAEQLGCSRRQVGNLLERASELCRKEERRS